MISFLRGLIISGAVHGILFFLVLKFNKKYNSKSNYYLSLVVLFLSLNNLYYWLVDTYTYEGNFLEYIYMPWGVLIVPYFYLFVRSFLELKINRKYIFIPFYFFLLGHSLILVNDLILKIRISKKIMHFFFSLEEYVIAVFSIYVIVKALLQIKKYKKEVKSSLVKQTNWLKLILFCGVVTCAFLALLSILSNYFDIGHIDLKLRYLVWILLALLIYLVGYLGVYHNILYKERKTIRESIQKVDKSKNDIGLDIKDKIISEKLYLRNDISLTLLADEFKLNQSYLSHIFNKSNDINFISFINKLRIEEAKNMLLDERFFDYTIVSIGLEAGFNSKSTFYKAFKKETGLSPVQFKKGNLS